MILITEAEANKTPTTKTNKQNEFISDFKFTRIVTRVVQILWAYLEHWWQFHDLLAIYIANNQKSRWKPVKITGYYNR